ncbi:MAG: ATP-binding protein, partial [Planctomycetes bacterium]|nr:ATP-binding protein [Planctomycetota bacterium]
MTISRLIVDKLGVKLYDRVSAVIAELIANSYDADAKTVEVEAPMDELLATKSGGNLQDKGYSIEVRDDGFGMTPDEVNAFYLV